MGFSRQKYWSGLSCLPAGNLPDPGIEPGSPVLQADSLLSEPPGKPVINSIPMQIRIFIYHFQVISKWINRTCIAQWQYFLWLIHASEVQSQQQQQQQQQQHFQRERSHRAIVQEIRLPGAVCTKQKPQNATWEWETYLKVFKFLFCLITSVLCSLFPLCDFLPRHCYLYLRPWAKARRYPL